MELQSLLKKPLPAMPPEIAGALKENAITKTAFANRNEILTSPKLQTEAGYTKMDDGTFLVSMFCPMPGISVHMIDWWFWWHPQDKLRYQVWYPGSHFGITYSKKDRSYFSRANMPAFAPNTQCPVERIGSIKMPLRLDFVTP